MATTELLETCPYDVSHRIRRSRMAVHILKCSRNQNMKKLDMKQCPLDACHVFNSVEYHHHVATCAGKESLLHYKLEDKEEGEEEAQLLPVKSNLLATEDSWDNNEMDTTYNPMSVAMQKPILFCIPGLSKAKKKVFREQQRKRFYILSEKEKAEKKMSQSELSEENKTREQKVNEDDEQGDQNYKPLRRPKKTRSINNSTTINSTTSIDETLSQSLQNISIQSSCTANTKMSSSSFVTATSSSTARGNTPNTFSEKSLNYSFAVSGKSNSSALAAVKKYKDKSLNDSTTSFNLSSDSIVERMSKKIEELAEVDEGHKKKTEILNKRLEMLKNNEKSKEPNLDFSK